MYYLHLQDQIMSRTSSKLKSFLLLFDPEDGGSTFIRNSTRSQGATSQKIVLFIAIAVRIPNLTRTSSRNVKSHGHILKLLRIPPAD
jgi:hypothetical protein